MDGKREADARTCAKPLAFVHGRGKGIEYLRIQLVERRLNSANTGPSLTEARNESRRESARTRSSIQKSNQTRKRPEHRRHEFSDRWGREELSEFLRKTPGVFYGRSLHAFM